MCKQAQNLQINMQKAGIHPSQGQIIVVAASQMRRDAGDTS
jgi:hypothetical protein